MELACFRNQFWKGYEVGIDAAVHCAAEQGDAEGRESI